MNFLYYEYEQFKHKHKVIFSEPDLIMDPNNLSEIQKEAPDRSYFESGYGDRVLVSYYQSYSTCLSNCDNEGL